MRSNAHLLEINIRQWIRQLNQKYNKEFSLASIPDDEWHKIKGLGFDAVWLLGIWQTSALAREISRNDTDLKRKLKKFHPDFNLDDIDASPHAVYDYTLDGSLGKPDELFRLKEKLGSLDLKLILDFYSNHVAADHRWVKECPHCFVMASKEDLQKHPDWFFKPEDSNYYIAYGKDPNFPPWRETAQFNHFCPDTRKLMMNTLLKISDFCDGVRCNKVMLTLNDTFRQNWQATLGKFKPPAEEFWPETIKVLREKNPYFIFLAEVYWGLEWRVQQMGFDYTYDQVLYDRLRWTTPQDIKAHLKAERLYQKKSLRFIDNHNEPPSATAFGREKSLAAAAIISTLEGLRLYHYKQLEGVRVKPPIRYLKNECRNDGELKKIYEKILKEADNPAYHGGEWTLLDISGENDDTSGNILCWHWVQQNTLKLIIVNYSAIHSSGKVPVKAKPNGNVFSFKDELSGETFSFPAQEISKGLHIKLPPYGVRMLTLEF